MTLRAALAPQSSAIVGASDNPHKVGGRPILYMKRYGFRGAIYPINPLGARFDPIFGPVVMVGDGGIALEALKDFRLLLPPFSREEVLAALAGLRMAPLLGALRGQPPLDVSAYADMAVHPGDAMLGWREQVASVDVNPVMLFEQGEARSRWMRSWSAPRLARIRGSLHTRVPFRANNGGGGFMKRRKFLQGAAAGGVAAAAATVSAPAISQGIKQLKMVTCWPKNFPGLGTGAERFAQRINTMSGGSLEVKVYAAGEMVPAFEAFNAVRDGKAEMSHSASYYWQGHSPAFNFFTAVPFGMNGAEHYAWMLWGDGTKLWTELCDQFNIVPFMRASTGVQMGGWYRKEMKTMDDFKGLKFRMPGLGGEVLRRLGATVVNLPGGEIFPALQAGTIDGTEWVGPWNDLAFGFYKVAPFYYWPGFHEASTTGEVLVNKKVWQGLSKQQQEIIAVAVQAEATLEFAEFNYKSADALEVLLNKHNVKLRKYSDDMLKKMGEAAIEVVAEVGNRDPLTKRVYASFMAARKKATGWSALGEQGFLNARSLLKS